MKNGTEFKEKYLLLSHSSPCASAEASAARGRAVWRMLHILTATEVAAYYQKVSTRLTAKKE